MAHRFRQERNSDLEIARSGRLEAIAMRRLVIERGYWLSPMLHDHPMPVLEAHEAAVNISAEYQKAPSISAAEKGAQVLERLDAHLPKRPASVPWNKANSSKTLAEFERLTAAERQSLEEERDRRKAAEIAEKKARFKEIETELRPQLTAEEEADRAKRAAKQRAANAKAKAEQTAELEAKIAASKARIAHRSRIAAMSPEERAEHDRTLRAQQYERRKAKQPPKESQRVSKQKVVADALNLTPGNTEDPLESAMKYDLGYLIESYLTQRNREAAWRAKQKGLPFGPEEQAVYRAEQQKRLDDRINEDALFVYKWKAQRLISERAHGVVRRESRRGNITPEKRDEILAELNIASRRLSTLRNLTPEQRKARRDEQRKRSREKAKAEGKTWGNRRI